MGTWTHTDHDEYDKFQVHNHFFRFTFEVLKVGATSPARTTTGQENPVGPRNKSSASMFATAEAQELCDHHGATDNDFDQCQYGLEQHTQPTQLFTNTDMYNMSNRCTHPPGYHEAMQGKDRGVFNTKKHSAYPSQLCQELAAAYLWHRIRFGISQH